MTRKPVFDPHNHRQACPLHSMQDCLTCHEVRGECSWGGCTRGALLAVICRNARGVTYERRLACACHTSVIAGGANRDGCSASLEPLRLEEHVLAEALRVKEHSGVTKAA